MRKPAGICFTILLIQLSATTQSYFYNDRYFEPRWLIEGGVFTGMMNCLTDLGGSVSKHRFVITDLNLINSRFAAGCFVQATINHSIGFRIQFTTGSIKAYDSILNKRKNSPGNRFNRNLHFKSTISEISLMTEVYPQSLLSNRDRVGKFQYYLLAGISRFHFNPKTMLNGNWIELQPLHTEGQGLENGMIREGYARTQWNIPWGVGVRFELHPKFHLRGEIMNRLLFTDYLDDVSTNYADPNIFFQYLPLEKAKLAKAIADRRLQEPNQPLLPGQKRGNPANNDSFFHVGISISYLHNRRPL